MKKAIVLALVLFSSVAYAAQEPPAVPMEVQNKILILQKEQIRLQAQLHEVVNAYNQLSAPFAKTTADIDKLKADAIVAAKLDPEKWDLDVEKWVFFVKPKPAAPLKAPTPTPDSTVPTKSN